MKYVFILITTILLTACGDEKTVLLPEIGHSTISEISDISPAYLFYDTTKKDSVELNRKNLISTTNWLVNIDKRLTLKQVIPHIKFLQNKKKNASHKNEASRNYFTCNNTSKKTLGFIDFTDVEYIKTKNTPFKTLLEEDHDTQFIFVSATNEIFIVNPKLEPFFKETNINNLISDLRTAYPSGSTFTLRFSKEITFQNYISVKSTLELLDSKSIKITHQEFIQD